MQSLSRTTRGSKPDEPGTFDLSRDGGRLSTFVSTAVSSVAHSGWVLIAYGPERSIREIVYPSGAGGLSELEEIVRAEHALHVFDVAGERVVRSRAPLGTYRHGLTVICGDDDWTTGLVVLLRHEAVGRFTEADVTELAAVAPSISAYLTRLGGRGAEAELRLRTRSQPAFFVLNERLEIEHFWSSDGDTPIAELDGVTRLTPAFEAAVRTLTARWSVDDPTTLRDGVAVPEPLFVLRVVPLLGPAGLRVGVSLERLKTRNAIRSAARRFGLSPRELEVLTLLLEGRDTREAAEILGIAPSTINDHVKRMLIKTQSRNRAELVARALGWKADPS